MLFYKHFYEIMVFLPECVFLSFAFSCDSLPSMLLLKGGDTTNYRQIGYAINLTWLEVQESPLWILEILAHHFYSITGIFSPQPWAGDILPICAPLLERLFSRTRFFNLYLFHVVLGLSSHSQPYFSHICLSDGIVLPSMYSSNASEWNGGEMQWMHFCCVSKNTYL